MNVRRIDLWYPGVSGEGSVDAVEVELVHVRAARSIRVTYDFDRDGFVISAQADPGDGETSAVEEDLSWVEKAFVPAWEEQS